MSFIPPPSSSSCLSITVKLLQRRLARRRLLAVALLAGVAAAAALALLACCHSAETEVGDAASQVEEKAEVEVGMEEKAEISRGLKFDVQKLEPKMRRRTTEATTPTAESFPDESLLVSDLYEDRYLRQPDVCQGGGGDDHQRRLLLLSLVVSAPSNFEARDAIRRGWARPAQRRRKLALAFLVGSSEDSELQRLVESEADEHGDIILPAMIDSYRNMTLKVLAGLTWAQRFCPGAEFLLKADDDVFVQLPRLAQMLRARSLRDPSPVILGFLASGWRPGRVAGHKYYISPEQFPGEVLPDFVTGPSYVMSTSAVELILPLAWRRPYLHLEDVFVTGILASEAGVPRRMVMEFKNNPVKVPSKFLGCTLLKTVSVHNVDPEEQEKMYEMAKRPLCGPPK